MTGRADGSAIVPRKRVLIADDDPDVCAWLKSRLRPLDIDIVEARSGIELLELIGRDPGIDLVITDIHMPGLSGNHATAMIREAGLETPIIVITAAVDATARSLVAGLRSVELLEKPLATTTLLEMTRHALALDAPSEVPLRGADRTRGGFAPRHGL